MRSSQSITYIMVITTAVVWLKPVHAEFQLAADKPAPIALSSVIANAEVSKPRGIQVKRTALTTQPLIARGFGRQVPLAFAVKQIVPAGVRVGYGRALDPTEIAVDWNGGRPWQDVLRSTTKASNLLVTFRPGRVLIER